MHIYNEHIRITSVYAHTHTYIYCITLRIICSDNISVCTGYGDFVNLNMYKCFVHVCVNVVNMYTAYTDLSEHTMTYQASQVGLEQADGAA